MLWILVSLFCIQNVLSMSGYYEILSKSINQTCIQIKNGTLCGSKEATWVEITAKGVTSSTSKSGSSSSNPTWNKTFCYSTQVNQAYFQIKYEDTLLIISTIHTRASIAYNLSSLQTIQPSSNIMYYFDKQEGYVSGYNDDNNCYDSLYIVRTYGVTLISQYVYITPSPTLSSSPTSSPTPSPSNMPSNMPTNPPSNDNTMVNISNTISSFTSTFALTSDFINIDEKNTNNNDIRFINIEINLIILICIISGIVIIIIASVTFCYYRINKKVSKLNLHLVQTNSLPDSNPSIDPKVKPESNVMPNKCLTPPPGSRLTMDSIKDIKDTLGEFPMPPLPPLPPLPRARTGESSIASNGGNYGNSVALPAQDNAQRNANLTKDAKEGLPESTHLKSNDSMTIYLKYGNIDNNNTDEIEEEEEEEVEKMFDILKTPNNRKKDEDEEDNFGDTYSEINRSLPNENLNHNNITPNDYCV